MKIITTTIVSLLFAGSVFAGCPSKAIKGKVVSFDEESKTLTVAQGKKEKKVQVGSKTKMEGFECPTKLEAGTRVSIDGKLELVRKTFKRSPHLLRAFFWCNYILG